MNCDERRDLLLLRSLGALTPDEEATLRELLAHECPPLAEVEAEVQATLAQLASGLPPEPPSPQARAAFLARLAAAPRRPTATAAPPATSPLAATSPPHGGPGGVPPRPPSSQPAPRHAGLRTAMIAGLVALIAVAVVWAPFRQQVEIARHQAEIAREEAYSASQRKDQLAADLVAAQSELKRSQTALESKAAAVTAQLAELDRLLTAAKGELAKRDAQLGTEEAALLAARSEVKRLQELAAGVAEQIATLTTQQQQLGARLAQAETTMAAMRSPQLKIIDLAGGAPQPKAWARLLWDQQRNEWHLLASNLAPLPAGKTYELWFITAGQQKVAAGTFNVDAKGRGVLVAPVPPNLGMLAMAAVTDEPMGGVAAPTGEVQLIGKL